MLCFLWIEENHDLQAFILYPGDNSLGQIIFDKLIFIGRYLSEINAYKYAIVAYYFGKHIC